MVSSSSPSCSLSFSANLRAASTNLDPSSTVKKVKILVLNDLEKGKIALALHFRAYLLIIYSSRNVGGSATPQARIAAEACAWS